MTLGAAGVTLAVIIAVLTGPSVVNCFNAQGGMGACLRDEMTQAGILPPAAPNASVETTASAPEPAPAPAEPTTDIALAPAATVESPAADAPADATDTVVAASFGLRVEPDGSVVIAGSGEPGSELEVYADDALIGQATVEPSGDWVLVPDAPLPTGGVEITLGETGKPGRSPDSFVVAIAEDRASEPLVVATAPGAASDVLQGLAPTEPTQLAAVDPVVPPAPAAAPLVPVPAPQLEAAPLAVTPPAPLAATPPAATPAAPGSVPALSVEQPVAASAPELPPPAVVATAEPAHVTPAPTATTASVPVTIDAIEIEGDRTFFAGAGPEGATTRLYVDDSFIADAIVSGGRWLVQAGRVLTKSSQRVRIDILEQGSADVQSRAEVNFEVDLPDVAPSATAVAAAPATPAPDLVQSAEAPAPEPTPQPSATANSPDAAGSAPTTATPSAEFAAAPPTDTPVSSSDAATDADIPTMVAVSVGDPEAARFASGKAIIRTGDNLWTIARRVYGEGIKYTTIYQANTGQIRDPDRIYPGQVFDLPSDATN